MNKNIKTLITLIEENPDLPVIPMVDAELVNDDTFNYWMGSFGYVRIEKCYFSNGNIFFKNDADVEDVLSDIFGWDAYMAMSDDDVIEKYEHLQWRKVIIVNIEAPGT